jgi:hypothetical protein
MLRIVVIRTHEVEPRLTATCIPPSSRLRPVDGLQRGAVIWEVTEGRGQFAGATGLITSNFTVGAKGEVVDNHYVRLFLPT